MTWGLRRTATFLALALLPALAVAERQGRLIGKVVDLEGRPIAGVTVTTTSPELTGFRQVTSSNEKGLFIVDFERVGVLYRYELAKTGYVTAKVEQRWTALDTERHEFKLTPAPAAASGGEAAAPASVSEEAIVAYNAAVLAFKGKDYAAAQKQVETALAHDAYLRQGWALLGHVQFELKRYREAADAADKAVALGATDEPALRLRWEAYRKLGDEAKANAARQDIEKHGKLTEEAKRIHNEAVALVKSGDDAGACEKFKEALAIDPHFQPALVGMAAASLRLDRPAEAASAAEAILRADPRNEQAIRIRYNASLKLADRPQLIEALAGLAAVDRPMALDGLLKLANVAFDSDDTVNAKAALRKLLGLDPDRARAHYLLGLILMREGAKQDARNHLERFLALAPDDPDAATARAALNYAK